MAKGSWVKGILTGLAGGIIALGGNAAYQTLTNNNSIVSTSNGTTKVNSTTYKVSSDTTTAIAKVSDAVVSVLNYQTQSNTNSYNSFFGNDNNNNSSNSAPQLTSEGSGVIYKKSGNTAYIVTNYHVVASASKLQVTLASGKTVDATLVGSEPTKDLAVIKINSANVTDVATFGDSSQLTVGEPAIAIGSPNGVQFANSATEGIVSATSRSVSYSQEDNTIVSNINAIQTDAAINPGNSGGALINIKGQVIGINSSKLSTTSDGTAVEGMGFAIPANDVVNVINNIEQGKKMPALGISMQDLANMTSSQLSSLHLPSNVTSGVFIAAVQSGLPADSAGLKTNDVITKLDNTTITSGASLQSALLAHSVGDTVKITYYRDGKSQTVSVHLTANSGQLSNNNSNSSSSGN